MPKPKLQHLPANHLHELRCYISEVKHALQLDHWRIYINTQPPEDPSDDCHASISATDGKYTAFMTVAKDWKDKDPGTKALSVIHEMCHLYHQGQWEVFRKLLFSDCIPEVQRQPFYNLMTNEEEKMVDHISSTLARLLPQWPGSRTEPHWSVVTDEQGTDHV